MNPYPGPYPGPYNQPPFNYPGYGAQSSLRAPARRAGVLMIVLGGLTLLIGTCAGVLAGSIDQMMNDPKLMPPENAKMFREVEAKTGVPVSRQMAHGAVGALIAGVVLVGLGIFVWRGGKRSVITGIVVTSLGLVYFGLSLLGTLGMGMSGPAVVGGVCMLVGGMGVFVLELTWLIAALRNTGVQGQFGLSQQQAYQQYQQYMQQYQQYGAGGAFWMPPPPPPGQAPVQGTGPQGPGPQQPQAQPPAGGAGNQPQPPAQADQAYLQAYGGYFRPGQPPGGGLPPPPPPGQPPVSDEPPKRG